MFDVIECFTSASPTKQTRLVVFQTPNAALAQTRADQLWAFSNDATHANTNDRIVRSGASTFIVVDRSTAVELYRVPRG